MGTIGWIFLIIIIIVIFIIITCAVISYKESQEEKNFNSTQFSQSEQVKSDNQSKQELSTDQSKQADDHEMLEFKGLSREEFLKKMEDVVKFSMSDELDVLDDLGFLMKIFPTLNGIKTFHLKFFSRKVTRYDVCEFCELLRLIIEEAPADINKDFFDTIYLVVSRIKFIIWDAAFPETSNKIRRKVVEDYLHNNKD